MRIRTRERALRAAASVVMGKRGAGAALALLLIGCPDSLAGGGGAAGVGDTAVLSDAAAPGDVVAGDIAALPDTVVGDGGAGAAPGVDGAGAGADAVADTAAPADGAGADGAASDTTGDATAHGGASDAAGPGADGTSTGDAAAGADAVAGGDTVDAGGATDTGGTPDTGGADVAAGDAADATGADLGCMQPTGVACVDPVPCDTGTYAVCFEGECYETDLSGNVAAQDCCAEKYAAGVFDAPGCTPWGPPAPPAFDRAAARRALRGLA